MVCLIDWLTDYRFPVCFDYAQDFKRTRINIKNRDWYLITEGD
jgi:hypothetical protein